MKKENINLLKAGVGIVVGIGINSIVGNVIKATTPADTKKIGKFFIAIAELAIVGLLAKKVTEHIGENIDSLKLEGNDEKVEGEPEVELA